MQATLSLLPTLSELVTTTCGVSETLFGVALHQTRTAAAPDGSWRAVSLLLAGAPSLKVVVAMRDDDLARLAEGLLADASGEPAMLLDSALGETVNLVAGQIKAVLACPYTMGLPQSQPLPLAMAQDSSVSATLVNNEMKVALWVAVMSGPFNATTV